MASLDPKSPGYGEWMKKLWPWQRQAIEQIALHPFPCLQWPQRTRQAVTYTAAHTPSEPSENP